MSGYRAEAVAGKVRDALREFLGPDLAAVWLYGASVFGHPFIDIDLHVLLRRKLTFEEWEAVRRLHEDLARETPFALEDLDFWYVSLDEARGAAKPVHLAPWASGLVDEHWALHRAHWLAGRCIVLHGPEPSAVVQAPSWEELEPPLRHELAAVEPSAYGTLQLCRVWASLATRDVVRSKLDSGRWALAHLPVEHHDLVQAAMRFYRQEAEPGDPSLLEARFPALWAEVRRQLGGVDG